MKKYLSSNSKAQNWILIIIPFLFVIGSLLHFAYDFAGKNIIIGFFTPISESIWEHMKLILTPMLLWWIFFYILKNKKYNIDKNKWFSATLFALITGLLSVPILFYSYTGAFGIESLIVDILILLLSILIGQLVGYHFYKHSKGINYLIPLVLCTLIVVIFIIFTVSPPNFPIFIS